MNRILSLYLPNWPVDRIRRRLPAARRKSPVVLFERRQSSDHVVACSVEAAARNVRAGITLAHARALVPDALFAPSDPEADAAALRAMALWMMRFSPAVTLDPPDGLFLDITGCQRLFGGEHVLLRRAVAALGTLGFGLRAAIADTAGTAWALSHASDDPLTIVPPDRHSAALMPLPPWSLRLPDEAVGHLDALGIDKIEQLLMLPRSSLPSRFGDLLLERMDQALGTTLEVLTPVREPVAIAARIGFDEPVRRFDLLRVVVEDLVKRVEVELRQRCCGALRLQLVLYPPRDMPLTVDLSLYSPSRSVRHLNALMQHRVDQVRLRDGFEVAELIVTAAAPISAEQAEFLESPQAAGTRAAMELFDHLAARLGAASVHQPQPVESHRPERAWEARPGVRRDEKVRIRRRRGVRVAAPDHSHHAAGDGHDEVEDAAPSRCTGPRAADPHMAHSQADDLNAETGRDLRVHADDRRALPTRLLRHPQPIRVMAVVPDQPPIWFRRGSSEYRVRYAAGPERISAEWWSDDTGTRDYYQVECEDGRRYWVFRELESGDWYIHGLYG